MENELSAAQNAAYDYRRCERVWQRVDPTLDPYPDVRAAAAMAADTPGDGLSAAERNAELTLPGAQADPCCMGTAAQEDIDVIRGFIEEELSDRRSYLACAASAPTPAARQLMRRLAAEEGGHARRLMGVHYLITGQNYSAAVPLPANIPCTGSWREVLRLRYHEESCSGLNYRRASEETTDECLSEILLELSHDEYRHARQLLCLLEKQMPI